VVNEERSKNGRAAEGDTDTASVANVPGAEAERPSEIPAHGWLEVAKRVKDEAKADNVSLLGGGVAFFALLAIVPLLVAVLALWGIFASPLDATRLIRDLASGLPDSAQRLVTKQLRSIANRSNAGLGVTAILSLVIALWSASSGTKHLIEAVNTAYDEEEHRGFVRVRALALGLTLGAVVFVLLAIGLIAVVPSALADAGVPDVLRVIVGVAIWPLLGILMIMGLAVLYRLAPDRDDPQWRWVSWGAVLATVLWLVGSAVFALYASNLGSYDQTYGSLGGVIVLMLWLYITAVVVVIGAEINAALETQTARDSTTGPERALGQRGAQAADTVAGG
jgi:membrane protein